jgi:3-oxoacyl-[acyl-carrier-protein] synthase II
VTERRLNIAGIGLAGGFGTGKEALLNAMHNGGKPNGTVSVQSASGQLDLAAYQADISGVGRFVSAGAARRMNRFGKLAVLGASLALEDAGWAMPVKRKDVGLVVASGYGAAKSTFDFLDSMIDDNGGFPSPTLFSNSVHSSAVSHLGITLELGGPCLTVNQFEMSPISALLTARNWLEEGQVEAVLLGVVEEICPVLAYCYDQFFGPGANGPIEPFAWEKQTAVMGEGAAFMLLTRDDTESRYGYIGRLLWTQSQNFAVPAGSTLVLGSDGQACCAKHYHRIYDKAANSTAFTPLYGSLPAGQFFDIAIAGVLAEQDPRYNKICSVKCDAEGNCGVIECYYG